MEEKETAAQTPQANPGYAYFQIARALTTVEHHEDAETRERAQKKITKWAAVIAGMLDGTLSIGSRTPVQDVPRWATLEVVTGGFATGELLAGGPLLEHERALLDKFGLRSDAEGRRAINGYFVSEAGWAQLGGWLRGGCYDVAVPEEGALLVVAWLVAQGDSTAARSLLEELGPSFDELRFYPIPAARLRQSGARVSLQPVKATIDALRQIKSNRNILAQKEAIQIWAPLYDKVVRLFLETVAGDVPNLERSSDGAPIAPREAKTRVVGGWPCQTYAAGWNDRARDALAEYDRQRKVHKFCGRPDRSKEHFAQLRKYLRCCLKDPKSLTGREVGRIRLILARSIAKHGRPDAPEYRSLRESQSRQAGAPTFYDISKVVAARLEAHPTDEGLDDVNAIIQSVTADESERAKIESGTVIPESLRRKVERCLCDTVEALVERKLITSGETLARVLPQITSDLRAAGITDPSLRRLYAAIYRAFRRRRSLLLLNLESQVRIEELPWVAAIERFRRDDLSVRELSRQALEEVSLLTIASFPHAILPNKLLQELRALASGADLDLPLVDELAADIFMGEFSGKFVNAAKKAGELLGGTLYDRYFEIDYPLVRQIPEIAKPENRSWWQRAGADPFVQHCAARAGVDFKGWDPATSGMIIEQQQIVTSQNLAVLFSGLGLTDALRDRLREMAERCFAWICRRQQMKTVKWHARLIMLKNTAYAWRQMIFYLALLPPNEVEGFLVWAEECLRRQSAAFQDRFRPAMLGLILAAAGHSLDGPTTQCQGARRFLGWSNKKHWLLES